MNDSFIARRSGFMANGPNAFRRQVLTLAGGLALSGLIACSDDAESSEQAATAGAAAGNTAGVGSTAGGANGAGVGAGGAGALDGTAGTVNGATTAGSSGLGAGAESGGAGAVDVGGAGAGSVAGATTLGPVNAEPTVAPDEVVTDDEQAVDCTTLQRPPTPLRRLTRFEYNNSVRDLFNTTQTPAAAFPTDEVADGFSNNALVLTVSALHAERYVVASEAVAAEAVANIEALVECDPVATGEEACAETFARAFGRRAYRRELEQEDVDALMVAYAAGNSFEKGIEVMIRAMLQSPHFLFRVEFTGTETPGVGMVRLSGYETASRLSYLLWGSTPSDTLLDLAAAGELESPEQVAAMARTLLADPKARSAVTEFYWQWLELTELEGKDKRTVFPLWSDELKSAMGAETGAFIEDVLWNDDATLASLLTKPAGLPIGPLAEIYGLAEGEALVALPTEERAGVLTLPGFLAVQAHPDQTSPVLRGKFVRTKMLCDSIDPPPDDVDATPPALAEGSSARERFAFTELGSCGRCHAQMNPLGYAFEGYDALGRYRTQEDGVDLDLSGSFIDSDDANVDGPFVGVGELAARLAASPQVQNCVATQWYKYAMGRGTESGDACSLSPLQTAFTTSGANLMELMVSTTQTEAFLYRRAVTEEVSP